MIYFDDIKVRFIRAWGKYGLVGAARHFILQKTPLHFSYVYLAMKTMHSCKVDGLSVIRYNEIQTLPQVMLDYMGKSYGLKMIREFEKMFSQGSDLWIGWLAGKPAGVCWSTRARWRSDYFVPLTTQDKIIYACFVCPQYQGRGIYPFMLQTIVNELMEKEQTKRVYIDCKSWNIASRKGIEKAGFVFLGKALRLELFNHIWIPWNQCR